MENDEFILTGQGEQENIPAGVDTSVANGLLSSVKRRVKGSPLPQVDPIISENIKNMLASPDIKYDNGLYSADQIDARRSIAYIPELFDSARRGDSAINYTDFKSDTGTIIKDSAKQFGMSLGTLGDKALISLGGIISKVSGNEFGTEMRDRAYDSLEARLYDMSVQSTRAADVETLTSQVTMGAASMLEMIALGLMSGGVLPLAQVGVDSIGTGTYNNMQKYAQENNGKIDGYEGNWADIGVDLANAAGQVAIERYFGVGSSRFLTGTGGRFVKEFAEGFMQESSQDAISDLAEALKGNQEFNIMRDKWQNYLVSGIIGGVLQGSLGAVTYKGSRMKADSTLSNMYLDAQSVQNKDFNREDPAEQQKAKQWAKQVNDKAERELGTDIYQELIDRVDANNDRGRVRDNLVNEITKARATALGIKAEEMDADDLADIQDAATILSRESLRMAWAENRPIAETLMGRVYSDGATLKIRELQDSDRGVVTRRVEDIRSDEQLLASAIEAGRTRARAERESMLTRELIVASDQKSQSEQFLDRVSKVGERQTELGLRKRSDGYTVKQIETNIRAQTNQVLAEFVNKVYGYNTRYFGRTQLLDAALNAKNQWKYIERKAPLKAADVAGQNTRQTTIQRVLDQDAQDLSVYTGVPVSVIETMTDVEYKQFIEQATQRRAQELADFESQVNVEDIADFDFQQSLKSIEESGRMDSGRGRYNPKYQEIILSPNSDISTILHEFSHLWLGNYFKAARSGTATKGFMDWWGRVEREIGIRPWDRFLDKDISEKFARGFEKYILDGGQGANEIMKPAYERLSKKLADVYDDLATRYFDMVGELKPEVQAWFAGNESLADQLTGITDPRSEQRQESIEQAKREERMRGSSSSQSAAFNDQVEKVPADTNPETGEPFLNPYTSEGQKERKTSKNIRNLASQQGVYIDVINEYNPYESKQAAFDAFDLARMDFDLAKDIAMGRVPPRGSIAPETMFVAVRNIALANNDAYTLKELQISPVQARITEAAQRLSLVRNYTGNGENNVVKMLADIQKVYDKGMTKEQRENVDAELSRLNNIIEHFDIDAETSWNNLLNELECK